MLARVFKDIFPRYRTMCGYQVDRKGGWDCHGLPVELAVEKELGMKQKADIEDYGIDRFNARCREVVLSHIDDWTQADRADRLLGRHRARVQDARHQLRRVGLVGAEDDLREGPAVRAAEGRARTARAAAPRSRATSSASPASTRT